MDWITSLDGNILLWIQENIRMDFLDPLVIFITSLGNAGAIWIGATVLMLCFPKSRKVGILAAAALLTSFVINNLIIKNLVARPRPWVDVEGLRILISKPADYSFPSGHTSSSFAAAVVIYKNRLNGYSQIGIAALFLALGIGLSRLYLGVHYPSDVLCGAVSGIVIALVICYLEKIYKPLQSKSVVK